jgi:hypothetical protein
MVHLLLPSWGTVAVATGFKSLERASAVLAIHMPQPLSLILGGERQKHGTLCDAQGQQQQTYTSAVFSTYFIDTSSRFASWVMHGVHSKLMMLNSLRRYGRESESQTNSYSFSFIFLSLFLLFKALRHSSFSLSLYISIPLWAVL